MSIHDPFLIIYPVMTPSTCRFSESFQHPFEQAGMYRYSVSMCVHIRCSAYYIYNIIYIYIYAKSKEVKKSNFRQYGQMEKQRWEESEKGKEWKRVRRKKMQVHEKVEKSRNTVFFQWFVAPEGRKIAEPRGQMRDEKLHAVVARHTFPSQNVQSTPWSDHFWKLRCRKSAGRCGAKHLWKSKCIKHFSVGARLEVEMSKKCTPLWRGAHF